MHIGLHWRTLATEPQFAWHNLYLAVSRSVALAHRLAHWPRGIQFEVNSASSCFPTNEVLLLTCHGSVMYLHVLATTAPLAHPPLLSISQAPASQDDAEESSCLDNDFQLHAFITQLLKPARLAPASARLSYPVLPKGRGR
ncbi:unnamed protein product [Protopolystoma xenopodis]|uniref:Uncharacterized protein n=1 Tax=Protopolystoma xenopodis TaxID=117903 RepID=A0A448WNP6_9PLAT|nr:unnamed protein product [Protopolystoma xenopodis]